MTAVAGGRAGFANDQVALAGATGGNFAYESYDAMGLAELVRNGDVTAGELLDEAIARTEAVNPKINAVVYKHYDEARAAIEAGLPEGPFTGVPFLLKNLGIALNGTGNLRRLPLPDEPR